MKKAFYIAPKAILLHVTPYGILERMSVHTGGGGEEGGSVDDDDELSKACDYNLWSDDGGEAPW